MMQSSVPVRFYHAALALLIVLQLCSARFLFKKSDERVERVKKIFVMGADSLLGRSAVFALSKSAHVLDNNVKIIAGVSDVAKAKTLEQLEGARIVKAEFGSSGLRGLFTGVDSLYLTSPIDHQKRVSLVVQTARAAKDAMVKHIVLHSLTAVDDPSTTLGREYQIIESEVSYLGIPHTILRLTVYMENFYGFMPSIKAENKIRWPVNPSKPFTPVALGDAAKAAIALLCFPKQHERKTYTIVSDRITYADVAAEFSKHLGRTITYEHITYNEAITFLQQHFSLRYARALLEVQRLIDEGSEIVNQQDVDDFTELTGLEPTSLAQWVSRIPDWNG